MGKWVLAKYHHDAVPNRSKLPRTKSAQWGTEKSKKKRDAYKRCMQKIKNKKVPSNATIYARASPEQLAKRAEEIIAEQTDKISANIREGITATQSAAISKFTCKQA